MAAQQKQVLPVIILSQFLCTTPWFGGNSVIADISRELALPSTAAGTIVSTVQFGFITGTLLYALFSIADRFQSSLVFLLSAVAVALANVAILFVTDYPGLLFLRFCTGFFLAGVYPVGMKIASDHFEKGLGKALGFLVGALVLGTAFPHLLKGLSLQVSWRWVLSIVSLLSITGGILMYLFVPVGPYHIPGKQIKLSRALEIFRSIAFRSAAFGYFGHMWELYAFWAFLPFIITTYLQQHQYVINTSLLSFATIAIGCVACIASGYISFKTGAKRTAFIALLCSGLCCLFSPWSFELPLMAFILYILFWGWMVIADSPMFSTLVAQSAPIELKGTALTMVTCIGFFITIISIELLNWLKDELPANWLYVLLLPGPVLGLIAMQQKSGK
jgi:MFS family permease